MIQAHKSHIRKSKFENNDANMSFRGFLGGDHLPLGCGRRGLELVLVVLWAAEGGGRRVVLGGLEVDATGLRGQGSGRLRSLGVGLVLELGAGELWVRLRSRALWLAVLDHLLEVGGLDGGSGIGHEVRVGGVALRLTI